MENYNVTAECWMDEEEIKGLTSLGESVAKRVHEERGVRPGSSPFQDKLYNRADDQELRRAEVDEVKAAIEKLKRQEMQARYGGEFFSIAMEKNDEGKRLVKFGHYRHLE